MCGGNLECLLFYHHDVGHSLEANCLRKIGLSTSPLAAGGNKGKSHASSWVFLAWPSIAQSSAGKGPQANSSGVGTVDLSHISDAVWERWLCVVHVPFVLDPLWPMEEQGLGLWMFIFYFRANGALRAQYVPVYRLRWWFHCVEGGITKRKLETDLIPIPFLFLLPISSMVPDPQFS